MSADNWTTCPQCKIGFDAARLKDAERVGKMYGKASPEKYLEAVTALKNPPNRDDTLREDYCQGMNADGVYSVEYGCSCEKCGFSFSFKHEVKAEIKPRPRND